MRKNLLGTLATGRRTELEERILCDPEVYEELLLNEEELIDQYVAGNLSNLEKQQFETHFLITAERQKNLRFGQLLNKYLNAHPALVSQGTRVTVQVEPIVPQRSFPFSLVSLGRIPALSFSAAVLLCLGILFCYWFATRRPAASIAQQNTSRLVVVTLAPGSTRSSGATQRVAMPPKGANVKLELEVANTSFRNYKSELFRESQSVATRDGLRMEARGDHQFVPVTFVGDILGPGDYQVKLSGVLESGQDEFIDNYSFRVVTE
jgi:hypothetical protein